MPLGSTDTRRHGWQLPLHPLQIAGASIFCFLVAAFYCFLGLFLGNRIAEITVNVVFSFVALCGALLFVRCAGIDPGDKSRFRFKKKRSNRNFGISKFNYGYIFGRIFLRFLKTMERKILRTCIRRKYLDPVNTRMQMEPLFSFPLVVRDDCVTPNPKDNDISFCYLCDFEVNRSSKHCRTCNRCVEGFDHHCRWLNNCVGKKNYTTFFLLMIFILIMLALEAGSAVAVFVRCFADSKGMEEDLHRRHYRKFPRGVVAAACVLLVLVTTYSMAALGQLFFFHVLLIRKGISTYDFILAMKEENQSLEFELLDSDFSSDNDDEDGNDSDKSERPAATIAKKQQPHILHKLAIRIDGDPHSSPAVSKEKQGFHAVIDPWKLSNLSREEALLAREKVMTRNLMVGRDPLKPLPLEIKSGLLTKPDKDLLASNDSPKGWLFKSPGLFSSPRRRLSCSSIQQQQQHGSASPSSSPKHMHKSDFDLKLTRVSRELETHISRQVLSSVLKKNGNEDSPR